MGRRRPSGLNRHEKKFATVITPDGKEAKIPQAKDAATYICLATEAGGWPERMIGMLAYDMTWLTEGTVTYLKEMRPGHGMGDVVAYLVLDSRTFLLRHEGNWMQAERWLLLTPVAASDDMAEMGVEDL